MDLYKHKVSLSDRQKNNLRIAQKKQKSVTIGLTYNQLSKGNNEIMLNNEQHKAVVKALKNRKGLRLFLHGFQVGSGLLNDILVKAENNLPLVSSVTPFLRKKIAPLLKEKLVPWLKNFIDEELDDVIKNDPKGSGLKKCINKKIDSIFAEIKQKN